MALKSLRKQHWSNNRVAAKAIGLGASTVAKVENLKGEPDYDPGVGVVFAFVSAASQHDPSLTLSSFFLQIERQTDGSLPGQANERRSDPPLKGRARHGQPGSVPSDHDIRAAVGQALLTAAASLTDAATARATESADHTVPRARGKKLARR